MSPIWRDLAVLTLRAPDQAALRVLGLPLPPRFLWGALALIAVLNAALYALAIVLRPLPADGPFLFPSPFGYLLVFGAGLFGMVWALYAVGRWMGGQGALRDVLALMVWLQALRIVAQAATVVLMLLGPSLSMLASTVIFLVGLWIGVHFVNIGHRLGSVGKAFAVLITAGLVTLMAVSVVMSVVLLPFLGDLNNV